MKRNVLILFAALFMVAPLACTEDTNDESAGDTTADSQADTTGDTESDQGEDAVDDTDDDTEEDGEADMPADMPIDVPPQEVTWYGHVKPIVDARCTTCHTDGGLGPFPLTSYEEAVAARGLVKTVVEERTMPPWGADGSCRDYHGDTSLTDDQIQTIVDWVDNDTPEGDPANEGPPIEDMSTRLSRIDLTLQMEEPYVSRISPDDYRCFVIDWPYEQPRYITGLGVTPGNKEVVHHLVGYIAAPHLEDEIAQLEAQDPEPGYTCFGDPKVGSFLDIEEVKWMGSWAPGGVGQDFPAGTGLKVEPGSKVIIQMHYNTLTAEPQPDQTSVHFKIDESVEKEAFYLPWANPEWFGNGMHIPANDPDVTHTFSFDPTFLTDFRQITMYSANLHMHVLGEAAEARLNMGGTDVCLLDIPNYDFGWQREYVFKEPIEVLTGDQLTMSCNWDNSADNQQLVDGVKIPPQDVFWGDGTTDEMCLGIFYITLD